MVAHDAVDIDIAERHFADNVGGHHNHAGDPEEDDFVARYQHAGRDKRFHGFGVGFAVFPAQCGERHERGGEPGVQHVFVAR